MSYTTDILKKYNVAPRKSFGQNFLIDNTVIDKICSFFSSDDIVIEIGPGIGSITRKIFPLVKELTAIELDTDMYKILTDLFNDTAIHLVHADILQYPISFEAFSYKMVGALPYTGSKQIIRNTIEANNPPKQAYYIIQKEVADKYLSGNPFSILSATASLFCTIEKVLDIPPQAFFPQPKVSSSLITITPLPLKDDEREEYKHIAHFIKSAFITPRKQLENVLASMLHTTKEEIYDAFASAHIVPTIRAEQMKKEDWISLYQFFKK